MITLKRGQMMEPEFKKALIHIVENVNLSNDAAWLFERYCDLVDSNNRETNEKTKAVIMQYASKDEKGEPKMKINTHMVDGKEVKLPGGYEWADEATANAELMKIGTEEVTFHVRKLSKSDLSDVRLPTVQWKAIRPFILELEQFEGGKK